MRSLIRIVLVAVTLVTLRGGPAAAQSGATTRIDPSVRSAAMGGASTAVFWSDDLNAWANPALLGYTSGVRYQWSNTELAPSPYTDFTFQSDRLRYGWGGIGLAVETHTQDYGQVFGMEPTESVRPLSVGISLGRVLETMASLRGEAAPGVTQYVDVAAGFSWKRIRLRDYPGPADGPISVDTDANDFGLLVRATPAPRNGSGRPTLDLAYGLALLNYNDPSFYDFVRSTSAVIPRQVRHGLSARVGIPLPPLASADLERRFGRWIAAGMDPMISVAITADFAHSEDVGFFGPGERSDDLIGLEFTLMNTLALRWGHAGVPGIDEDSFGIGFGLSLADFAGARYDYAAYPQAIGWADLDRHAVAVWFDPIAFRRR